MNLNNLALLFVSILISNNINASNGASGVPLGK
jgi:hypothetical protein